MQSLFEESVIKVIFLQLQFTDVHWMRQWEDSCKDALTEVCSAFWRTENPKYIFDM